MTEDKEIKSNGINLDRWIKESKKYNLSNFKEGFQFFLNMIIKEMPDFPIDKTIKVYKSLFAKHGIPFFKRIENLPSKDRNNSYIYFFNETMQSGIQLLGIIGRLKEKEFGPDELSNFLIHNFGGSNANLLIRYWREWEIQYNAFVEPTFKKLNLKLSRRGKSKRERQIEALKDYLIKKKEYRVFVGFLNCLNTELRNAIAHLHYYVDDELSEVTYFSLGKNGSPTRNQISIFDIIEKLTILLFARLFMIIYISDLHN
jgi:hypothetical protein